MGKWSKQEPMVTATARFLNKSRPDLQILSLKFAGNKNEAPRCEQDANGGGKWLPLLLFISSYQAVRDEWVAWCPLRYSPELNRQRRSHGSVMNSKRGNHFPPAAESFRGVTLSILNYAAGKRSLHVSSYKSFKKRIAHPKSRIVPALVWNTNVVLYRSSTSPRNGWKKGSLQRPFLNLEERERERVKTKREFETRKSSKGECESK